MQDLDRYLRQIFGGRRENGRRLAAVGSAHAVHEAGYEVFYSRYSVTYRDLQREVSLGAEFDNDGVLIVHSRGRADAEILSRIDTALRFLEVRFAHK